MPAALQPGRKTFKENLISFYFPFSMQRLKENDVRVFCCFFFPLSEMGENFQEEKLFLISVYYYFLKGTPNTKRIGIAISFVVLNMSNPV